MNKFTLGAAAGATSLLVAVPLLAQMVGAASSSSAGTEETIASVRPIPSVACVTALATAEGHMLSNMDAVMASQKQILTAHHAALTAAAALTDDTAREAALTTANETMRTAMKAAHDAMPDKSATKDAIKEACGDAMGPGMGGMMGPMGFGPGGPGGRGGHHGMMKGKLAGELGMTEEELKAEIDSGKTIEQIAEEKGVTLPPRPMFHEKMGHGPFGDEAEEGVND